MINVKHTVLKACRTWMPDFYRPPASLLLPFGHIVTDEPPVHVKHLYTIPTIAKFKSDLDFLCQRFRPIQISELEKIAALRNDRKENVFLLSFDDGMREVYEVIAPILKQKGLSAIFFLNSAMIDNKELMWRHKISLLMEKSQQQPDRVPPNVNLRPGESLQERLRRLRFSDAHLVTEIASFFEVDFDEYLRTAKPYLTSEQVIELSCAGFEFGAHSHNHPYFDEIPFDEQKAQISASVQFVRNLGLRCRYFAFPFHDGGVSPSLFKYISDLDVALSFGTSEARRDTVSFSFQRFSIDARADNPGVREILRELSLKSVARRLSGTELIRRIN